MKRQRQRRPTEITGGNGEPLFARHKIISDTDNKQSYIRSIARNEITFCSGPSGTGKSWVACGLAASMLLKNKVSKIVLTRPAVECGEKLGHLPGEVNDKLTPFLVPLFDALSDFLSPKEIKDYQTNGQIEICALAFMRGRTLRDAFVILDEAENCTYTQLKMFLTRFGQNCKMVVNGDVNQSDLDNRGRVKNPFERVIEKLENVEGIGIVTMTEEDIMRPWIVREIVKRL